MKTKNELRIELEKVAKDRDNYKRYHEYDLAHIKWLNEIIDERTKELEYFKDKYAEAVWDMGRYVAFFERAKTLFETFEEEKDKPKIMTIDLTNQPEPELEDLCNHIASVLDKIVGDENG